MIAPGLSSSLKGRSPDISNRKSVFDEVFLKLTKFSANFRVAQDVLRQNHSSAAVQAAKMAFYAAVCTRTSTDVLYGHFTRMPYARPESDLCVPARGSIYGRRHSHADKHGGGHRFCSGCTGGWRTSQGEPA